MRRFALPALAVAVGVGICLVLAFAAKAQQDSVTLMHAEISCSNVSATPIVVENRNRRSLIVQNFGANVIYIGTGTPAALATGTGYPLGIVTSTSAPNTLELVGYKGALSCLAATGATALRYIELLN